MGRFRQARAGACMHEAGRPSSWQSRTAAPSKSAALAPHAKDGVSGIYRSCLVAASLPMAPSASLAGMQSARACGPQTCARCWRRRRRRRRRRWMPPASCSRRCRRSGRRAAPPPPQLRARQARLACAIAPWRRLGRRGRACARGPADRAGPARDALAGPQAAAARRNGRFLALVEARARAPAGRHRRSGNFAYVHHAAMQDAVLAARPCAAALHRDEGHAGMQGRAQPLRAQHRPQSRRRTAAAPRRAPSVSWPAAAPRRRGATCWRARWPRSRARWARCWAATRRPRRARWTSGWPPSSRGAAPPAVGLE